MVVPRRFPLKIFDGRDNMRSVSYVLLVLSMLSKFVLIILAPSEGNDNEGNENMQSVRKKDF
jgi:hypothetical protein